MPCSAWTPLPMRWIPALLCMPDALFRRVFGRMLAIDPLARSSMQDDLDAGRLTEVDWLCGEVVRLAQSLQPGVGFVGTCDIQDEGPWGQYHGLEHPINPIQISTRHACIADLRA